ncbi:MAG TPA: Asp-tRNA(Asn)/Glu-tRNA(Gln) amidotransferase GatCAB subunit B, partial [Alphaproteobacteria bacterium]|nr:Asp-tRNA(Asn)/Glu-tRNA(Gln) amidotransferase GatCAB subunit B [Alphaproteobacteria bacterium]
TRSMRSKEEAHDYRYFPDPDLLPLELAPAWVAGIKASLPELPDDKKARFISDYGLTLYDAGVLVAERESAAYFEAAARGRDAKLVANWVTGELFGALNKMGRDIANSPVPAEAIGELVGLISDQTISGKIAKDVFAIMLETGEQPGAIVEARGLRQVTDTSAIEKAIEAVIAANPAKVEEVKAKPKLMGWFVGQVMAQTQGRANPQAVNDLLKARLGIEG